MSGPFSTTVSVFFPLFLFVPLFRFCIIVPSPYTHGTLRNSAFLYHCSVFVPLFRFVQLFRFVPLLRSCTTFVFALMFRLFRLHIHTELCGTVHFWSPFRFFYHCSVFVPLFRFLHHYSVFVLLCRFCIAVPFVPSSYTHGTLGTVHFYHFSVFVPLFRFCMTVSFVPSSYIRGMLRNSVVFFCCIFSSFVYLFRLFS